MQEFVWSWVSFFHLWQVNKKIIQVSWQNLAQLSFFANIWEPSQEFAYCLNPDKPEKKNL